MAEIPKTVRSIREKTLPDWLQKWHEGTDPVWQLKGKDDYKEWQASQYRPPAPVPEPVPEMPDPEEVQRRQRKATATRRSRGRAATIFTPPGEGLGG